MKVWVVCYVLCSYYTAVIFTAERFGNVALHKPCNMSSKYDESYPTNAAVNGKTGGIYGMTNCIHTARGDLTPWWEVNLGRPYPVNGASRSGLFGIICNVISRMTSEQEVDVYMAVRNAHMVRPQCVTSQVQYRFIYQAVQEYTKKTIYSNI